MYNANLGFSDLANPDASDSSGKKYALFIGDTVVVNEVRRVESLKKVWESSIDLSNLTIIFPLFSVESK